MGKTIRRFVRCLNNVEEEGGFWLPNIQRPFVWDEDQICCLFDSILRQYPISTLLVWKTTDPIRSRKFIDIWSPTLNLSDFYIPPNNNRKCLVLDGQQRLQSLYIGLCGTYSGKELYFDILSGQTALPDETKYKFEFREAALTSFPWVNFKDLVLSPEPRPSLLLRNVEISANRILSQEEREIISQNIENVVMTFVQDESITYRVLDGIDRPDLYQPEDIVEIFIRANSGGTKLEKSDLLFTLLNAAWDQADDNMENMLERINRHGFAFDRDFVLKTCLVLLNQGARYQVNKFREPGIRESIVNQWNQLADSILAVIDWIRGNTYIQCAKALPSNLALIPLIYVRHHFPESWNNAVGVDSFLVRTLITGGFSGQSDRIIDALVGAFREQNGFNAEAAYQIIAGQNRSLAITRDRLFEMGYGSKNVHLIFNLWYREFNHVPAYDNNLPQIDHIFPRSRLGNYNKKIQNQLANCMLLTRAENGAGGKGDTVPATWFADKDDDYLDLHLIPRDRALWEMDRFEDFINERKNLIAQKFHWFLMN